MVLSPKFLKKFVQFDWRFYLILIKVRDLPQSKSSWLA
jgi:hypothetical protein